MSSSERDKLDQASITADKLSNSLSLNLTGQDVHQHPKFVELLTSLTSHINESGVGIQVFKDLTQAEDVLHHEKHSWLLVHILYHELQEMLLDYDINSQDVSVTTEDKQFKDILQHCLTYAELGDYLDCDPDITSKTTLLGISHGDVQRLNQYKEHLPSIQQKLIPEIEKRLRKKCEHLVHLQEPDHMDSAQMTLAKASQLPSQIEKSKLRLEENKRLLKEDKCQRDRQFWLYFQTLVDSLKILVEITKKYCLQGQSEFDTHTSNWLVTKCDAMCLKVKLLELEVLCDTYTAESIEALRVIKSHLKTAMDSTEKDYSNKCQTLKAFEAVGMGFDRLVEEYTVLRGELENKRWALSELKNQEQT
ncbi:HAUS augmin-like complex subunit 4 [Gigantopelta aegis]|uniref:HAUS augmin-like complex subunit 4 n=1 Tax=Gigantopelta aegis TaxID=1735272 RepID=UPI001B88AC8C|nr:HAUS augmin-like complex subunit 4 [Gigantopelta aegis]XP_041375911.1 HAUS augmin-like complex subunit 4 [Gigantopelta aegis]